VIAVSSLLLALLLSSCGVQRRAAESAVAETQVAIAGIGDQAENVAPDEAKMMRDALAQARDDLEKGNFSATLTATRSLRNRVKDLADRLPEKQAALEAAWTKLDATIPTTLASLDRKLGRTNRPSAGARRAAFEAARTELASLATLWSEAQAAKQIGRLAEAVTKAGDVKYRALRLLDGVQEGS
jgi:hypothetical protein